MSTPPGVVAAVRIVVNGARGRMGARVCALALEDDGFALVGALDRAPGAGAGAAPFVPARAKPAENAGDLRANGADVVIDFSSDEGAREAMALATRIGAALLVGTTALGAETRHMLREGSKKIPVMVAPNTSLGVSALARSVREIASMLGARYRCSIVEAHHAAKKDAPSGTAIRLAEAARSGGADLPEDQVLSIRAGDVVGEHTVRFAGPGEYIELTHRATSRDLFARGALRIAVWLKGKGPGWWTVEDVLEIGPR
jgi:4-hydroxy-tetrahydrodipicolinate reductase